jgi:hypothetical protein
MDRSLNLPMLTLAEANRLLEKTQTMGRVPWMKAFRQHVREKRVPGPHKPHDGAEQPSVCDGTSFPDQ